MKNLLYFEQSVALILQDSTVTTFTRRFATLFNIEPPQNGDKTGLCFASGLTVYQALWAPLVIPGIFWGTFCIFLFLDVQIPEFRFWKCICCFRCYPPLDYENRKSVCYKKLFTWIILFLFCSLAGQIDRRSGFRRFWDRFRLMERTQIAAFWAIYLVCVLC